jgi:hypothetical protein
LVAEKQFSKITPWANAQHPHHSQTLHTPHWNQARPNSPFTPLAQSRVNEPPVTGGSASTVAASHAPTPLSSEVGNSTHRAHSRIVAESIGETPSKLPLAERDISASTPQIGGSDKFVPQNSPTKPRQSSLTGDNALSHNRFQDKNPNTHNEGTASHNGEGRIASGFASHNKIPAEVKVGIA